MNAKRRTSRPKFTPTVDGMKAPKASTVRSVRAALIPSMTVQVLPSMLFDLSRVTSRTRRDYQRLCNRENIDYVEVTPNTFRAHGHYENMMRLCAWIDATPYAEAIADIAVATSQRAAGSGPGTSASSGRAIARSRLSRDERESRYARECPEYSQTVRDDAKAHAKRVREREEQTTGALPGIEYAREYGNASPVRVAPASPGPLDCGFVPTTFTESELTYWHEWQYGHCYYEHLLDLIAESGRNSPGALQRRFDAMTSGRVIPANSDTLAV